ncbi:MAG TPA: AAA family ATPase [Tepidisphaeraceae bacterium]|nr:AAA family ATPase [Tepidisphaeraceae bacterium]
MPSTLISRLEVKDLGPISSANIEFGGLTVLVGPQASGKSIFLQTLKLLVDTAHIKYEFRRAGVDWKDDLDQFLDVYFGEGMRSLWQPTDPRIVFEKKKISLAEHLKGVKPHKGESMFFIPAQRVLAMRDGWPQAFGYYDPGIPFAVREFSEELRQVMADFGTEGTLFPVPRRLKEEFSELIQEHIFPDFQLRVDTDRAQKRMVLSKGADAATLPFMVWSAGQREFVPLLLGLYWLLTPAGTPRRKGLKWVVVEELEMGLHPRAVTVVILMLLELVARGYRVCLSTHSPQVLDAIWAVRHLRKNGAQPEELLRVFDAPNTPGMLRLAEGAMKRRARVYYFGRDSGGVRNISDLDPESRDELEAGWGGLSEFSARANEAVAHAAANSSRGNGSDV